jgi:hypothetical protein
MLPPLHSLAEKEEGVFISNNVVSVSLLFNLSSCAVESGFHDGGCIFRKMYPTRKEAF